MLALRPNCECCDKDLPPHAADAMICTFECTFCRDCVETRLGGRCPNCGAIWCRARSGRRKKLAKYPPSTERVFKPQGCGRRHSKGRPVPGAMQHEVLRCRPGTVANAEFEKVPGLQRTVRFAHAALRPGQASTMPQARRAPSPRKRGEGSGEGHFAPGSDSAVRPPHPPRLRSLSLRRVDLSPQAGRGKRARTAAATPPSPTIASTPAVRLPPKTRASSTRSCCPPARGRQRCRSRNRRRR